MSRTSPDAARLVLDLLCGKNKVSVAEVFERLDGAHLNDKIFIIDVLRTLDDIGLIEYNGGFISIPR